MCTYVVQGPARGVPQPVRGARGLLRGHVAARRAARVRAAVVGAARAARAPRRAAAPRRRARAAPARGHTGLLLQVTLT